ncbi:ABC transporter ATP-binding protein [Terrilactibacillus sp. S3-3]|nr:ABC transporter ATP-binding protein [Terrilactibacillus sp. S3-3]
MTNAKLRGLYNAGGQAAGSITFLASLCLGAYFVSEKTITVGALLTFTSLVNHLVYPLTGAAGNWASFQSAAAAVERIQQVLDQPVESKQLPIAQPIVPPITSIAFENVSFHYESDKPVLRNFSLTVPIGKKVAIVGASGAGKTTLFNLLQGFYHPEEGHILIINGRPLDSWPLFELRQAIAHVSQDTFLFNGTIKDNLLLGTAKVSKKALEQAAESAAIHSFITSLPKGYRTEIGERGIKLSGGQKQRLAIARAILKNAPILLLDEATSALDGSTERQVKEALDKLMAGRTTFIIAHRLSTIQNADIIVVMKDGHIVEQGRHEELIQAGGLYADLYRSGHPIYNEETRLTNTSGESVGFGI